MTRLRRLLISTQETEEFFFATLITGLRQLSLLEELCIETRSCCAPRVRGASECSADEATSRVQHSDAGHGVKLDSDADSEDGDTEWESAVTLAHFPALRTATVMLLPAPMLRVHLLITGGHVGLAHNLD